MSQFQFSRFNYLPPVIKNLLILNGLVWLACITFPNLIDHLALSFPSSPLFKPYQFVTHMFTHQAFTDEGHIYFAHIFFNMFSLWMFGAVLENVWGPKRFLTFYLITGLGAAMMNMGVNAYQLYHAVGTLNPDVFYNGHNFTGNYSLQQLQVINNCYSPVVGASGAIYGVLIAFGMLFPNTLLYIYFLLPVKAKYVVAILIGIEIYMGFVNSGGDNIAHFAHLGGALFGFLLVKYWGRNKNQFY